MCSIPVSFWSSTKNSLPAYEAIFFHARIGCPTHLERPPHDFCRSGSGACLLVFYSRCFRHPPCLAPTSTPSAVHQSISAHFSSPAAEAILRPATHPPITLDLPHQITLVALPQQAQVSNLLAAWPIRQARLIPLIDSMLGPFGFHQRQLHRRRSRICEIPTLNFTRKFFSSRIPCFDSPGAKDKNDWGPRGIVNGFWFFAP